MGLKRPALAATVRRDVHTNVSQKLVQMSKSIALKLLDRDPREDTHLQDDQGKCQSKTK